MRLILNSLGLVALALTILPACFVFAGHITEATMRDLMVAGMIMWFAAAMLLEKFGGQKTDR